MSLIETASSGKGLAWLGTLIGVFVFAVLLPLGLFARDDDEPEQETSAAVQLAENEGEIALLKERIRAAREQIVELTMLSELRARVEAAKGANEALSESIAMLREDIQMTEWSIKDCIDQYREKVREEAEGMRVDVLETATGKAYHNVKVVKVDALGMSIMHRDGSCRIPYHELSAEMQERYQFSEEEAQQVKKAEMEHRRAHNMANAAARNSNLEQEEQARRQQAREEEKRRKAAIRALVSSIRSLSSEIKALNKQMYIEKDRRLSRMPQLRAQLADLNARKREQQGRLQKLMSR